MASGFFEGDVDADLGALALEDANVVSVFEESGSLCECPLIA